MMIDLLDVPRISFLLFTAVLAAIRFRYQRLCRDNRIVRSESGLADYGLIALVFVAVLPLPLLYTFSHALDFADYQVVPGLRWCGLPLKAAGLWLFWRSHLALGRNWSGWIALRQRHQLVTAGVYRFSRHPQYLAVLIYGAGLALLWNNWLAGPSTLLAAALLLGIRAPREEVLLLRVFPDDYRDYARSTPRLLRWRRAIPTPLAATV